MKKALVLLLGVCFVALLIGSVAARDAKIGVRPMQAWSNNGASELDTDPGLRGLYQEAAANTLCIAWFTFETNDWQGWTRLDLTELTEAMFHVDSFQNVGAGNNGHVRPIEGTKSMWCGAKESDFVACGWETPPGYGNYWTQALSTGAFTFTGQITLMFHAWYDSEPDYDYTRVQYDLGGGSWEDAAVFTGYGDTVTVLPISLTKYRTKLRFRFSADTGYSDSDGLYDSDGAFIVDSISVTDEGILSNLETFESCPDGAKTCGIWTGTPLPGFGMYSGLANNLQDKDPCGDNFATQIVFFVGSSETSSDYPGLFNTPWCSGATHHNGPCQNEMIISPALDLTKYSTNCDNNQDGVIDDDYPGVRASLGGCRFGYTVYRDLPLTNLVFYTWGVRSWDGTCWTVWKDDGFVYYGPDKDYLYIDEEVGSYIESDLIQIGIGCADMCEGWYATYGTCPAHTPSPWFDNIRIYRYETVGPQWTYQDLDFFQDNFPSQAVNLESTIRADGANDIAAQDNFERIDPGDSIVVSCTSLLGGGIAYVGGDPAVYLHVKATYIGKDAAKPAQLHGADLCGSVAWEGPVPGTKTFSMISDDGTWTVIQCAEARSNVGTVITDWYMVDLNDEYFTRGYKIDYYFTAVDNDANESALPRYARSREPYFEWTCLPTLNSDVLFVDDCDGRGSWDGSANNYWDAVFAGVLTADNLPVDRYDTRGPSSGVSNGLGSRVRGNQLVDNYMKIVWDSGELSSVTICSATDASDKSNDAAALHYWMATSEHPCGLWVLGEGVARDLNAQATLDAIQLMNTDCGVAYIANSYFELTGGREGGGVIVPLITGDPAGIFYHGSEGDQFYAYGGCFVINPFDVIDVMGTGTYALDYPDYDGDPYYAGVQNEWVNGAADTVRTMWWTMSMQYVRDVALVEGEPLIRNHMAADVFSWMDNLIKGNITPAETPKSNKLAQNFPNPFNPSTSIKFDVRDKGVVTLKVYNVAGQLVRTLVNGVKDAGSYTVTWDGKNDRGGAVASGIYFYKMDTKNFSQTKKMVMLR